MHELESLEKCYDVHADAIYGFLLHLVRDEFQVKDVMQDLFIRIAKRPDMLKEVKHQRSFLIRMAHRMVIDRIRRQQARSRAHESFGDSNDTILLPPNNEDAASIDNELQQAMKSLPTEQSTVIHLKLREEMTFDQIAETLDISLNTAASRYRYGLEKLRTLLKPLYEEIK